MQEKDENSIEKDQNEQSKNEAKNQQTIKYDSSEIVKMYLQHNKQTSLSIQRKLN